MIRRYALRDDPWERIQDRLSGRPETVGVTARDNRLFVEAVLYRYRSGSAWRDLPARFGDWKNVHRRFGGNAPEISSIRSQTEETFVEDRMGKQHQSWTVEEKLGIVLAVLSERQSVAEVSRQHGVNENQIHRWKEQFLAAGRQGLNGAKAQTADQRLDAENSQLKKLLGEKALEIEILKKVSRF